ncbi:4Fe-4S binding protein [candidate division KSB1 bacterium]|nr:4Fe-4S binding protein [candidate division KSB1 bacterium]
MPEIKMTFERKKKLKQLLKLMDKQNERMMPPVKPLIESVDMVITEDELDYLLKVGTDLFTYEQAVSFSNLPEEKFDDLFHSVLVKGFIRKTFKGDKTLYILNALLVGWFEAQTLYLEGKPEEAEFLKKSLVGEYLVYFKKFNFFPLRNIQNAIFKRSSKPCQSVGIVQSDGKSSKTKTIEVNRAVKHIDTKIYPTKTVNDLIEEFGDKDLIVRLNKCMCRLTREHQGKTCLFNMPETTSCITFGEDAKTWVEYGHGQPISKQEALDLIHLARDKGAIHSVFHERDDATLPQVGICSCCWDCCGLFSGYNSGANALSYSCFFSARVADPLNCTGCGICEKYCPTTAASILNKKVVIRTEKCIGCGQCVHQCPQKNVIELIPNQRNVVLPLLKKSEVRI